MLRAAFACCALAVVSLGCVTYDFEPVVPLALAQTTQTKNVVSKALKPNLMLVVDKSGSMKQPIDPSNPNCPANCGSTSCPANCPTRISDLRNAMDQFLMQSGSQARMGLIFYPIDNICGGPMNYDVALPAPQADDQGSDMALRMNATNINNAIQAIPPNGGTPTLAALQFAGDTPGLLDKTDERDDFILLLTDGLPNCDSANLNQMCVSDAMLCGGSGTVCQAQIDRCKCTVSNCVGTYCAQGCLDQDAVVQQTIANKVKGIKTIVVGFGADTAAGNALDVLNAIAEAGDFPRACPNGMDSECGSNNRCLANNLCEKKFYQASNAGALSAALANIIDKIGNVDVCKYQLTAQPTLPEYLAVIVNDQNISPGPDTWTYSAGEVTFTGQICTDLRNSTTAHPVKVEIRIVESL